MERTAEGMEDESEILQRDHAQQGFVAGLAEDDRGMALALREAAAWVKCSDVVVERVTPASLKRPLEAALRRV